MSSTTASSATRATAATPFRRMSGTRIRAGRTPAGSQRPTTASAIRTRSNGSTGLLQDPFRHTLEKDGHHPRAGDEGASDTGTGSPIQSTEKTYSLMMAISKGLGVNCTFCHNTREFGQWPESTPQRVTAWHGIQMVRHLNDEYLDPLKDVFPATASDRSAMAPSSIARPATRARTNRCSASASPKTIQNWVDHRRNRRRRRAVPLPIKHVGLGGDSRAQDGRSADRQKAGTERLFRLA